MTQEATLPIGTLVYYDGVIPVRITDYEIETEFDGSPFIRYEVQSQERGTEWLIREDFSLAQSTH